MAGFATAAGFGFLLSSIILPSPAQLTPERSGNAGVAGALRAIVSAVPVRAGVGVGAGVAAGVVVPGRGIFITVAGTAGRGVASRTGRTAGVGSATWGN